MRIKCKDCANETNRKCLVKNTTINPGKDRKCELFELDPARELTRLRRAVSISDRYEARQAAYREFLAGQKTKTSVEADKHPLTGDLSRFKTTGNN